MQEAEIKQDVLKRLHEKVAQFIKTIREITYLSFERLSGMEQFRGINRGIPLYH
jgi:ribosome maturation protein Sdo1